MSTGSNFKKSLFRKLLARVKSIDMYGKNISLTYDGDDKYRTYIGGVSSIFVGSIIITYVVYLFYIMLYKHDTNISTTSSIDDIFNEVNIHKPGESKFDFAISFIANGVDYMQDPTAFTIDFNQVIQEWNSTSEDASFTRTKTPITLEKCGTTNFKFNNQAEVKRIGVDEYYCPTISDYSVAGSFYAESFHYLELKIQKCTGSASCKSDTDINNIMKESRFNLALVNSIVNFDDYKKPIQQVIDDGNFWELTPGIRKKSDLFIRYNLGTFEDDYFQLGFETTHDFYQVIDTTERFETESSSGDVLSLYFRLDKSTNEYERKIFSFGELLGLAGGFYGALLTIGSIFISVFSDRLYIGAVLGRIYKIDTSNAKAPFGNMSNLHQSESQDVATRNLPSSIIDSQSYSSSRNNIRETSKDQDIPEQDQENLKKKKLLEKCENNMKARRPFSYGYCHIIQNFLCCIACRSKRKIFKTPNLQRHAYFTIGKHKLTQELDCITLIKTIKQLKILTQVLLTKEQKFLIKYQRQNIINSASSDSSDEVQKGQPRRNHVQMVGMERVRKQSVEGFKISKVIEELKRKRLDDVDIRIIKGIFKDKKVMKEESGVDAINLSEMNTLEPRVTKNQEEIKKDLSFDRNSKKNLAINQISQIYYPMSPISNNKHSNHDNSLTFMKIT
ncbi:unnamed protein product [Moneuplotes crassus]|uniref:Uncharacterized protein n=1 Tax=Euplotes crassus TaxID=5936 RepID=A0AAD2DBG2_EUPCR|nr:unnamed protein product [Moneuplotes crassus]